MTPSELLTLGIQALCASSAFFIVGIFYHKGQARKTMILMATGSVSILFGLLVIQDASL